MKLSGIETHEHLQAIKKGMVMNMNNKNWVSVWGNAVSIAEHHPEAYANTLHYVILYTFHLTETLSALHLIITAEARPLLSQEPLFLQPLPLFMKNAARLSMQKGNDLRHHFFKKRVRDHGSSSDRSQRPGFISGQKGNDTHRKSLFC